jgi:hypothetical protein
LGARFVAGGGVLELSYTFEVGFSCAGLGLRVAICGFCAFALSLLRAVGWVFLLLKASDVFWVHVLFACVGWGCGCAFGSRLQLQLKILPIIAVAVEVYIFLGVSGY